MDGPRTIIIYIFRELDLSGDREVVWIVVDIIEHSLVQ